MRKTIAKTKTRKPRVATREQRVGAMFEKTNEAYNKLMDTHLKLVEKYNELLEQNISLRIQVYRFELSGGVLNDDLLKDDDWASMEESVSGQDDAIYGKNQKPVNQQRNTNDLYKIAKKKHSDQYQERLEQYAEQEEEIERAVAEAKVSDRPLDVKLSESKEQYYIEAGKTITGKK